MSSLSSQDYKGCAQLTPAVLAGPIPFPTSRTLTSTPLFSTTSEHDAARQTISSLNDEAFRTNYSSAFLRKTVQDLQSFIKTEELTHMLGHAAYLS